MSHWYEKDEKGLTRQCENKNLRHARKSNGKMVASITTLTAQIDKPQLTIWKTDQMMLACLTSPDIEGETLEEKVKRIKKEAKEESEKAAALGTRVHKCMEVFCESKGKKRTYTEGISKFLLDDVYNYLLENFDLSTAHCEMAVSVDEIATAGRFDLLVKDKAGTWWIIDFKTQNIRPGKKANQYDEYKYQLSGYHAGVYNEFRNENSEIYDPKIKQSDIKMMDLFIGTNPQNPIKEIAEFNDPIEIQRAYECLSLLAQFYYTSKNYKPVGFFEIQLCL